eukprot:5239804-Prymnesium_polylepis.1
MLSPEAVSGATRALRCLWHETPYPHCPLSDTLSRHVQRVAVAVSAVQGGVDRGQPVPHPDTRSYVYSSPHTPQLRSTAAVEWVALAGRWGCMQYGFGGVHQYRGQGGVFSSIHAVKIKTCANAAPLLSKVSGSAGLLQETWKNTLEHSIDFEVDST